MYDELSHVISEEDGTTKLTIKVPFGEQGDLSLKKAGAELIVSVGRQRRTIILPSGLARLSPTAARLEAGSLEISFAREPKPQAVGAAIG